MGEEPVDYGIPLGLELGVMDDHVILRFKLNAIPQEGEPVLLAIPPEGALTLALAIIRCVQELRYTELDAFIPPLDPKQGN